jgi:hypothetical protein
MWIWENNTENGFKETGCKDVDLIYLTLEENRLRAIVNTIMNFLEPQRRAFLIN